jgi:drug/metabolite transporter (DMT)-like permease
VTGHPATAATHAEQARANRTGALAIIGAMACFVLNDGLVKYASETIPGAQLIFLRGVVSTALVLAIAAGTGVAHRIGEIAHRWVLVRALSDALTTVLFLWSLFHLPISTATAILMTSPLMITVLAPLFAGPRLGPPPWLATSLGFVGVLLIVQPRADGFNAYALVCLVATLLASLRDLMTRRVPASMPTILVTLSTTFAVTVLAGVVSVFDGWGRVRPAEAAMVAAAAVFLSGGYFLIVRGMRHGDVAVVVPFRYTALLFAMVVGYAVWGELPNALAWGGIALVVGAGIYVLRQGRRARAAQSTLDGPA